jgi:hypothetical protein
LAVAACGADCAEAVRAAIVLRTAMHGKGKCRDMKSSH